MYPHLVLLPGLDGTGVLFRPLLNALPSSIPTTVVSYPVDQALTYKELLVEVQKSLPTSSRFVLLGESFSGPLAIMAAALHPPGLAGVILSASFCRSPHPYIPSFLPALIPSPFFRLFAPLSRLKAVLLGYSSSSLQALLSEGLSQVLPRVLIHRLREVLRINVTSELAVCSVPVLYLRGTSDLVVPRWNSGNVIKSLPSTILCDIPSPHMVLQTQPQLSAEKIVAFLNSIKGS